MAFYDKTIALSLRVCGCDDDVYDAARDLMRKVNGKRAQAGNQHHDYVFRLDGTALACGAGVPPKPLAELSDLSRLYLVGHGGWISQTLAGWDGAKVANWLHDELGMATVNTISLVSCSVAADRTASEETRLATSVDSFASRFTAALRFEGVPVYARYFAVYVRPDGSKYQGPDEGVALPKDRKAMFYKSGGRVLAPVQIRRYSPARWRFLGSAMPS
jgi:hypothetical protein